MTSDTLALLLDYADAMESLCLLYEKRIPPSAMTCADRYGRRATPTTLRTRSPRWLQLPLSRSRPLA